MAHRAIDVPIESLPAVDEHTIIVGASLEHTWEASLRILDVAFNSRSARLSSRLLGCAETERRGDLLHPGGTLPGFVAARAIKPVLLALLGEHRYSAYALIVRIDRLGDSRSQLRIETRAEFPGLRGSAYRALVIGTRAHVVVVRRLLSAIRKRAERRSRAGL